MTDRDRNPGPAPACGPPAWFFGDMDDPWVVAIADALPSGTSRVHAPDGLPDLPPGPAPGAVVVHRMVLTRRDAEFLARLRTALTPPPRVVLCFGPHVRYAEMEGWSALADAAIPEATARDTVAGHLKAPDARRPAPSGPRPRVAVVSANAGLRRMLADACEAAGYPASAAPDWSEAPPLGPAVWDVPVLERDWPDELARRARSGPVVALIGFADRALVAEARARGAWACLELPLDLADLADALDRLPAVRAEPAHEVPPPPAARRRQPRAARGVADARLGA